MVIDFNIMFKQLTTRRRKKSYFHRQMTSLCFIYITNVTQALTSGEGETVAVATLGKAPGRVYNYSIQDSTNPWIWRHVVQSLLVDLNTYRFINENRAFFKDGYKVFFEFGSRQVESWKKIKVFGSRTFPSKVDIQEFSSAGHSWQEWQGCLGIESLEKIYIRSVHFDCLIY